MKEKREYTEITITVLKETEEHIKEMAELTHTSVGHIVDRLALNWAVEDPAYAAYLILEDLLTHTVNLDWDGTNQALAIVIATIRKSLADNDPEALKRLVRELDETLNPMDKKYLS